MFPTSKNRDIKNIVQYHNCVVLMYTTLFSSCPMTIFLGKKYALEQKKIQNKGNFHNPFMNEQYFH